LNAVVAEDMSVMTSHKRRAEELVANRTVHPRIQLGLEGIDVAFFSKVFVFHRY